MKTTLKVIKIGGGSKGVIIPNHIINNMTIKVGDLLELDIKKYKERDDN